MSDFYLVDNNDKEGAKGACLTNNKGKTIYHFTGTSSNQSNL